MPELNEFTASNVAQQFAFCTSSHRVDLLCAHELQFERNSKNFSDAFCSQKPGRVFLPVSSKFVTVYQYRPLTNDLIYRNVVMMLTDLFSISLL